jgi:hypothetical protein
VTEREAAGALCPFQARPAKCVASACMGWRWAAAAASSTPKPKTPSPPPVGYCGPAGKPDT